MGSTVAANRPLSRAQQRERLSQGGLLEFVDGLAPVRVNRYWTFIERSTGRDTVDEHRAIAAAIELPNNLVGSV